MARDVTHPTFHHMTLETTRPQEMIDFYAVLVGAGFRAARANARPAPSPEAVG